MTHRTTSRTGGLPTPADPDRRRESLLREKPKPPEGDSTAHRQLEAILASPSYRQSDQDLEFLERSDLRGVRLQIDYLKPELFLEEHGIEHTIVVFGSTRIREPGIAKLTVEELRAELAAAPGDTQLGHRLAVAERLLAKSSYYTVARRFGRLVGEAGGGPTDSRVVLVTGGGPGMMEAANRGALDVGAKSVGLNIALPHEQHPNPYITPELSFRFHYFALRKLHFLLRARALVAFPGGYGTFDELFETLTLIQTRTIDPVPVVLVGKEHWQRAFDVGFLVDEGVIDDDDRELFWYAETAEEIWQGLLDWHDANGTPLFDGPGDCGTGSASHTTRP
jgi:uncharacterized protein (TIGR00730 family)